MQRKPAKEDADTSLDEVTLEFKNDQDLKDLLIGVYFQKDELINKLPKADATK